MRKNNKQKQQARRRKAAAKRKQSAESKATSSPLASSAAIAEKAEKPSDSNAQEDKEESPNQRRAKRKANRMSLIMIGICGLLFAVALGFAMKDGSLTYKYWLWVITIMLGLLAVAFYISAHVIEPREAIKQAAKESDPDRFFISNRAYLSIGNIRMAPLVPLQPVTLIVTWANDGNTPAEIRGRTRLVASSFPNPPAWSPNDGDHLQETVVPPHAQRECIMSFEGYSTSEIEAFVQARRHLLFAAKIVYRTLDTDIQWDVCSLYDVKTNIFVQCVQDSSDPKPPSGEPIIGLRKYSITDFTPGEPITATVELINNGTATATSAIAKIGIYWAPSDPSSDIVPPDTRNAELLRSNGGAITLTYAIAPPSNDVLAAVKDGRLHFYVFGVFEYTDYRSTTIHSKRFCIRFGPTPADHSFCSTWNDAD